MNLANGHIRPGVVKKVDNNGIIKAISPGLFVVENENEIENLPPIMPGFIGGTNVSLPSIGDDVWILNFTDNPLELFWFKKTNSPLNTEVIRNNLGKNSEILCNKSSDTGNASLYFSDDSGWVIDNTDAKISIEKNGSILLNSDINERAIHINTNNISIGSINKSSHPAAYGDVVEDVVLSLCSLLNKVAIKALANPYTAALGVEILSELHNISDKAALISSDNVTID